MMKWLRPIVMMALCASPGLAVDWKALRPQGCVSDFAAVVDPRTKTELEAYCQQVEEASHVRISLISIASLEGEPLDDVARTIFRAWDDGAPARGDTAAAKDQRVMVIVTVNDRHDWVGISSGLKPELGDDLSGRILRESRAALRKRDYGEAFRAAAETIGETSAKVRHVPLHARIGRKIHWSPADAIPWIAIGGAAVMLAVLMCAGNPKGYGGFGGHGLLPGLIQRGSMRRSTWGSKSSGGFGGFDSGDSSGGFGGGCCRDW
ncbi:MAG TPA: TPM domain-containing protein [Bryobacteraceae bacterium]|nr:TPM domain-containing protein [Bryobacteraceae bacterium]